MLIGSENEGKLYSLGFGEKINLSAKGYSLEIGRLLPDFDITANGEAYSKSERFNNPAVELLLYKDEKLISKTWAFYKDFKREPFTGTKIKAILIGFPTKKYVIMDLHRDKGAVIVLAGSLLFISAFLSYFIVKKRYNDMAI
jgi:predicted lipase